MSDYFKNAPLAKEWKRSTFPIKPNEASMFTSFNLGDLVPLYEPIEVLPHDTFVFDMGSLIRMPDAIQSPIMDGLKFDAYAFFVPKRLVWNYTKEFYGQNDNAGARSTEYTEPRISLGAFSRVNGIPNNNVLTPAVYRTSLASHFGVPYCTTASATLSDNTSFVNVLPFRAYYMIWNYYFRDQNLQNAFILNFNGNGDGASSETATTKILVNYLDPNDSSVSNGYGCSGALLKAAKKHDYFTSLLPYAEKAATSITIPLGTTADVVFNGNSSSLPLWKNPDGTNLSTAGTIENDTYLTGTNPVNSLSVTSGGASYPAAYDPQGTLVADLSTATTAAINTLREALALHRLYEIDAIGGTRYDEQIFAHFGSRPLAETFKPEELGEIHFDINVDQVLSHTGNDTESIGSTGAYSVTGNKSHFVTKSFTEPGYIILLGVARQANHIYSQGLSPLWSKHQRFDYFYPEFQNMGLMPKYQREIMALNTSADDNTFGFGEYGADYRVFKPLVTGLLNPNLTGSLDYWTLADELADDVSLSSAFIQEDSSNLSRALVTGSSTDQFVARFGLTGTMTRVVPVYSIPKGL